MIKFIETAIVFDEIPNEVTLAINISGCPCHCPDCHSKYLWEDKGTTLNEEILERLIEDSYGITCVCFMGGDNDPSRISSLAAFVKSKNIRTGWYSGRETISNDIDKSNFDYIKIGPYKKEFGSLKEKTTNQHLYKVNNDSLTDITYMFWN